MTSALPRRSTETQQGDAYPLSVELQRQLCQRREEKSPPWSSCVMRTFSFTSTHAYVEGQIHEHE